MNNLPLTSCKVHFSTFCILKLYDFFKNHRDTDFISNNGFNHKILTAAKRVFDKVFDNFVSTCLDDITSSASSPTHCIHFIVTPLEIIVHQLFMD